MDPRCSVSAVSSWRWSLDEDLSFWAAAGIGCVGLSFRKLEEAGLDRAVTRVLDAGLRVSNIVELGWCRLDDAASWARQQERLHSAVDVAARLSPESPRRPCLVLTTGPAGALDWDSAAAALAELLVPVLAAADERGVAVTIEPTGPLRLDLSFVTTLRDGVDLARLVGTGVCMEVNSCFAERALHATIAAGAEVLTHVQLSDFVIGSLCTPDRAVPGDGDIPLAAMVGAVLGTGYTGAFELELVGPRIEEEGYASAITRSVRALDELFAQLA